MHIASQTANVGQNELYPIFISNVVHKHAFLWTPMWKAIDRVKNKNKNKNLQLFIQNNQGMAAPLCIHTRNFGPRVFSRVKSFSRPESVENFNEPLIQNVHVKIKKEKISDAIVFCFILSLMYWNLLKLLCLSFGLCVHASFFLKCILPTCNMCVRDVHPQVLFWEKHIDMFLWIYL